MNNSNCIFLHLYIFLVWQRTNITLLSQGNITVITFCIFPRIWCYVNGNVVLINHEHVFLAFYCNKHQWKWDTWFLVRQKILLFHFSCQWSSCFTSTKSFVNVNHYWFYSKKLLCISFKNIFKRQENIFRRFHALHDNQQRFSDPFSEGM